MKKKKEKKKQQAIAANEGANVEEEQEELAPSPGPGSERPEADSNNRTLQTVGGVDKAESDDSENWEVERCRCIHCLELDNAAAKGFPHNCLLYTSDAADE